MTRSAAIVVLSFFVFGAAAWSQGPVPLGDEFQVNTYTTSSQSSPAVDMDADGAFIVSWDSDGSSDTDTDGSSVQGQAFLINGSPTGIQFQVNTYTTSGQYSPDVAIAPDGRFLVVWASRGSAGTDTDRSSVQGQVFLANGSPMGSQFQVNTYTYEDQRDPAAAARPDGSFIVVWNSDGSYSTDDWAASVQGQRLDQNGSKVGGEFQVNAWTNSSQENPDVGAFPNGEFVVTWQSWGGYGTDDDRYSIQMGRFNASGNPMGSQVQVNSYVTHQQLDPQVAMAPDGRFLIVWQGGPTSGSDTGSGADGDRLGVSAQRFDATSTAVGNEIVVNTYTTGNQSSPSVAADLGGNFLVNWRGDFGDIYAQMLSSAGSQVGSEFLVNTYTTGSQSAAAVAAEPGGTFVVVYGSNGSPDSDTSETSVRGQRLERGTVVLLSAFETADTSEWSSTVQ